METETIVILLFSAAAGVAIAVRQLHVPYTVALVLTGLALGILNLFAPIHLTKELLFSVFLPGLLFEAAFHIEFSEFWRNRLAVASLAVPGVAAAVALTTVVLPSVVNVLHLEKDFTRVGIRRVEVRNDVKRHHDGIAECDPKPRQVDQCSLLTILPLAVVFEKEEREV